MKNRILSILTAIAVAASLSACQAGDTDQTPPLSEAVVSEATQSLETTIQSEIEQISNLTFEDINIIEINGKQVSLPFKVEDLGEGYQLVEDRFLSSENEITYELKYRDDILAYVKLDNEKNVKNVQIPELVINSNIIETYGLSISDININASFDDVRNKFGVPKNEYIGSSYKSLFYQYDLNYLMVSFRNDKIEDILISYNP